MLAKGNLLLAVMPEQIN
jgi:hypothetical protein